VISSEIAINEDQKVKEHSENRLLLLHRLQLKNTGFLVAERVIGIVRLGGL
jgi:hypothetical protein